MSVFQKPPQIQDVAALQTKEIPCGSGAPQKQVFLREEKGHGQLLRTAAGKGQR